MHAVTVDKVEYIWMTPTGSGQMSPLRFKRIQIPFVGLRVGIGSTGGCENQGPEAMARTPDKLLR